MSATGSMSPTVAGVEIRVAGQAIDPLLADQLLEVRLESHLLLADTVSIRLADPLLDHIDSSPFDIGSDLEVLLGAPAATSLTTLFDGQITTFEPEFTEDEVILAVRGYDRSHLMNRTPRTETYQEMTYADIARQVAGTAGLQAGTIDDAGGSIEFVQQSDETDWDFLWRLARPIGFIVTVAGKNLNFCKPQQQDSAVSLTWGTTLLSFRPRVSAMQQVSSVTVRGWDPVAKQAIVGQASDATITSSIGLDRSTLVGAFNGGPVNVCDHPISTQAEADAVAAGVAQRLAEAYVEAEGDAIGDARLTAGTTVDISGVGERFGGKYTLTEAIHVIRARTGYHTHLRVSGGARRGFIDLTAGEPGTNWRNSVVVGVVTSNSGDPQGLGRVRVKYPALDDEHEGWWARIAAPSAGANRGLLMLPVVGDEVLLAFEHGDDEHPYIIGAVWNGQAQPQTLVHDDGSFALRSDHQLIAEAAEQISIKGDDVVALEAGKDMTVKAGAKLTVDAQSDASLQSTTNMTVKGVQSVTVQGSQATLKGDATTTVSAGGQLSVEADGQLVLKGATIQIQGTGMVQISAPQIMLG
jgi:phage protein D